MGIPVRAVVDLDFAFKVAPGAGLIPSTHHGIVCCKEIFAVMAEAGEITLGQDGLPRGGNGVSAAAAYAMMAEHEETAEHIQAIHVELLKEDIWCWTKGAIETHLNLASKSAAEHYAFLDQFENADFREALANYGPVRDMVHWAAN